MAEGVHYDVLVVGAGIIGLSSAYHIKKSNPDLSVLVVDRNAAVAQGETAKSVAAFRDCFTSEVNRLLAKSTIEFYKHIQSDLDFNLNMRLIGYLWLLADKEFRHFESIRGVMEEHGVRFRLFDRSALRSMIPDLVPAPQSDQAELMGLPSVRTGVLGTNCGVVSPELVADFYKKEFERLGGECRFHLDVSRLRLEPKERLNLPGEPLIWQEKQFHGVESSLGSISADRIVLTCGTRTQLLLDPLGVDSHSRPKKRQVFCVRSEALERLLASKGFNEYQTIPMIILPKGGVHFRPVLGEKSVWIAAADHLGRPFRLEEEPAAEEQYYLHSVSPILSEYFPCFAGLRPVSSWAGHYDINSFDGAPVIQKIANCVVATGMSGSGIMKADAIGRLVAAALTDQEETRLFDGSKIATSALGIENRSVERESFVL